MNLFIVNNVFDTFRLYDKRHDFNNFHIVNFHFSICHIIPSAFAYGAYVSQTVHHAGACCNYQDSVDNGKLSLVNCCHRVIAERSLYQHLKRSMGNVVISLIAAMWPFLNLVLI